MSSSAPAGQPYVEDRDESINVSYFGTTLRKGKIGAAVSVGVEIDYRNGEDERPADRGDTAE